MQGRQFNLRLLLSKCQAWQAELAVTLVISVLVGHIPVAFSSSQQAEHFITSALSVRRSSFEVRLCCLHVVHRANDKNRPNANTQPPLMTKNKQTRTLDLHTLHFVVFIFVLGKVRSGHCSLFFKQHLSCLPQTARLGFKPLLFLVFSGLSFLFFRRFTEAGGLQGQPPDKWGNSL